MMTWTIRKEDGGWGLWADEVSSPVATSLMPEVLIDLGLMLTRIYPDTKLVIQV